MAKTSVIARSLKKPNLALGLPTDVLSVAVVGLIWGISVFAGFVLGSLQMKAEFQE